MQANCTICSRTLTLAWAKANAERHAANGRRRRAKDPDAVRARARADYATNKAARREYARMKSKEYREKSKARRKIYDARPEVRQRRREREAAWRKASPNAALAHRLRERLRQTLNGSVKSGSAVAMLGCSLEHLRAHLERQFAPGMTWENRRLWHVDHIRPLASFELQDEAQCAAACHYTNLQPLWEVDNKRKGARFRGECR